MKSDERIAALDRGLAVLDLLIREPGEKRFTDFKSQFAEMTDATLTRLLKALQASGYLQRNEAGRYERGEKLQGWEDLLTERRLPLDQLVKQAVINISECTNCSASFVQMEAGRLVFRYTQTQMNAPALCPDGTILYFEPDHAAALAFLDAQPDFQQRILVESSEFSRMVDFNEFWTSIGDFKRNGYFVDQSRSRIGISRLAIFCKVGLLEGVFFIGLTTVELDLREQELATLMKAEVDRLVKKLA